MAISLVTKAFGDSCLKGTLPTCYEATISLILASTVNATPVRQNHHPVANFFKLIKSARNSQTSLPPFSA
jgi:hypothetical protein